MIMHEKRILLLEFFYLLQRMGIFASVCVYVYIYIYMYVCIPEKMPVRCNG